MKDLLDASIIVGPTPGRGEALRARFTRCAKGEPVTAAIAYAKVAHGSPDGKAPAIALLRGFVEEVPVLPFDDRAALAHARLPFRRAGHDRLIAAHALALDLVPVTANADAFADVPSLPVENWTLPVA